MPQRKTRDIFVIQSNHGYGHGFEDVCAEDTLAEARARLREYRENEALVPHRMVKRRERIVTDDTVIDGAA